MDEYGRIDYALMVHIAIYIDNPSCLLWRIPFKAFIAYYKQQLFSTADSKDSFSPSVLEHRDSG